MRLDQIKPGVAFKVNWYTNENINWGYGTVLEVKADKTIITEECSPWGFHGTKIYRQGYCDYGFDSWIQIPYLVALAKLARGIGDSSPSMANR